MNNNLVIVPAGTTSEHQKWSELHLDCGFDLCLLNFTKDYEFTHINSKSARFQYRSEGIKFKLIFTLNLQSNGIIECVHQMIAFIFCILFD